MTCRQFPNLTFAPRKTRHILTATSRFIAIMSQLLYTTTEFLKLQAFYVIIFPIFLFVFNLVQFIPEWIAKVVIEFVKAAAVSSILYK